jgi:hypothetical protein
MLPELHRYITEEEEEVKGPRVIKLDTPKAKPEWKPPPRLAIYMSRIELPDLAPKKTTAAAAPERPQSFVPPKAPTPTTSNSYSSSHLSSSSSSSRPPQSNTSGGGKPYQSPNLPPRVSSSAQTRPPTSSSHAPAPQPPQSQYSENHFSKLFKTRK